MVSGGFFHIKKGGKGIIPGPQPAGLASCIRPRIMHLAERFSEEPGDTPHPETPDAGRVSSHFGSMAPRDLAKGSKAVGVESWGAELGENQLLQQALQQALCVLLHPFMMNSDG